MCLRDALVRLWLPESALCLAPEIHRQPTVIYGTIRDEEAFPFLVDVEIVKSGPVVMLYDFGPEFCFDCEIGIKQ